MIKRITRKKPINKKGSARNKTDWDNLAVGDGQVHIATMIPQEYLEKIKVMAPLWVRWGWISKETAYEVGRFCIMSRVDATEQYLNEELAKQERGQVRA